MGKISTCKIIRILHFCNHLKSSFSLILFINYTVKTTVSYQTHKWKEFCPDIIQSLSFDTFVKQMVKAGGNGAHIIFRGLTVILSWRFSDQKLPLFLQH